MISFSEMSSFDVVVLFILVAFLVRGVWIGFLRQLAAFFALLGSYWLAGRYTGQIMPYVDQVIENPKLVFLVSFGILFLASALLFILAGKVLHRVMELTLLGWFDRFLGLLLGGLKGAIVTSLLYMFLASSVSASNELLQRSVTSGLLKQGADTIKELIQDPQLRQLFLAREPAIPKLVLPKPAEKQPGKND